MVNTILDEKDSQYFGFTSEEVSDMAAYYGKKERLPEIQAGMTANDTRHIVSSAFG